MVEWVLIHLHTRLLLWEEIDVIQYPYCWCESSGISWRCRTLAYQKLWRGGSLATKVPPKRLSHWAAAALDTPVGWWLVRGLYNPISWRWSEWGASWIPYSPINGISGFEHCEICYSLVHPGHLHPFAPQEAMMTMTSCEEAAFGTTAEFFAQSILRAAAFGTAAALPFTTVQRWRLHSSVQIWEKKESRVDLRISMHLTDIKRGIGSAYHDRTD